MLRSRGGAALLACVAAVLLSALPAPADVGAPFKITSFVLQADGSAALQWQGESTNIVVQFTADVASPAWQPLPGVAWPINGSNWSGVIPMNLGKGFLRVVTTGGAGTAPIPLKTISLSLIGWHDPQSDKFMENCIACHGPRTEEVALDGRTPTAHSLMQRYYSPGNARCLECHYLYNGPGANGPDFLTQSAGSLREQVSIEYNGCTDCHSRYSDYGVPLYDRWY